MTAAFGIAYDWMYDALTDDQKSTIRQNMITYGLSQGLHAYQNADSGDYSGWWANKITGNWNCVNTNGLTAGALAIWDEDTTQASRNMVAQTIPNALTACAQAISSDGTWLETQDYCAQPCHEAS